jgi:hypothetical protein
MKRNERRAKLGTRYLIQSASHLKKEVPLNFPCDNYTMKEGMRKKGKEKGTWPNWSVVEKS